MPNRNEYNIGDVKTTPQRRGPMGGGGQRGMMAGEKAHDFKGAITKLLGYAKRYVPAIALAATLALAGTILNLIGPGKLADMTDLITAGLMTGIDTGAVKSIAVLLMILYGLGFIFSYSQHLIMATVTQKVSKNLRRDISQKINLLPLKYFDSISTGDLLSRVTNDVDTIGQSLNQSFGTLITAVASFIGSLFMMLITNWIMTLAGVLASILGFAMMMTIVKRTQKHFAVQQSALGELNGHIEETYAGQTIVRAYNGERAAKTAFDRMNGKLYVSAWKSQFLSGLMHPLMNFIGNLGYVVVCVVGAVLTLKNVIPFSTIIAFMLYIRLFTQPLTQMAQSINSLQSAAAASERVFAFLEEEEMSEESGKTAHLDTVKGDVEFRHVRFGYDPAKPVIHDFSAKARAGQKIAIVGPTGAGKTTMVNLLMRFYDVQSGEIRIDGVPVSSLTRENVHDLFCMVLQDTWLFEGTVKDNIIYSKVGATEEDVIRACKAVGLHRFIKTLPQGYDTVLDDKANLSAGQRQLVTIARAMVKDAPMLILDEATSSVDTRTEELIQQAMDKLMAGRTSFVIAHRLSTIRNADLILVMKEGDIIESGRHEELMQKGGFYAELYNSQFEQTA